MERGIKFASVGDGCSAEFSDNDLCSGITLRSLLGSPMTLTETSLPPFPDTLGISPAIFDFLSNESTHSKVSDESIFSHMPDLRSLEPAFPKRGRFDSVPESGTLESVVQPSVMQLNSPASSDEATRPLSQRLQARNRRQKVSERMRLLGKLMPWNKKMDMSTLLEEASKYIIFLQAQILALQSMPTETSFFIDPPSMCYDSRYGLIHRPFGILGKLSRQQLLQILVSSPEAQSILFAHGCCVFSAEQLLLTNYN